MKSISLLRSRLPFIALLVLLTASVHAGHPLICHPYSIGDAASLPGGNEGYKGTDPSYNRTNLTSDTLTLLTPDTPLLVRMETLRRAAIYATANLRGWARGDSYTRDDRRVARDLLTALEQRQQRATGDQAALALFDVGFFSETLRQTGIDPSLDGYSLLVKAATLRRNDPVMELALALASAYPKRPEHSGHIARARAGATDNSALAVNLQALFGNS